jgi:hypothetical protein
MRDTVDIETPASAAMVASEAGPRDGGLLDTTRHSTKKLVDSQGKRLPM